MPGGIYGRRSEKLDPNQLLFDGLLLEAIDQAGPLQDNVTDQLESLPSKKPPKRSKRCHPGRLPIPGHIERREIVLDIPEKDAVLSHHAIPYPHSQQHARWVGLTRTLSVWLIPSANEDILGS